MPINVQQFFLQKRGLGYVAPILCTMRGLAEDDIEEAVEFHKRISDQIGDADIFCEDNTIAESVMGEGLAIGVYAEGRIIALRSVSYVKGDLEDAVEDLKLDPEEIDNVAVMDFCVTDKAFRGNYIQFFTYLHIESLMYPNRYHLYTTVSPRNVFSLRNVLKCGFIAVDFKKKYGGHNRFVLYKNLRRSIPVSTRGRKQVLLRNFDYHPKVMEAGFVGYKTRLKPNGMVMLYGRPLDEVPEDRR
ncbi:MAG: hypothetical protein GX181_00075 [Synergistaceae bacterium]|jgi:hypothetical protein|nr:hypothetical protein [Synergistota bacterium]NLM70341.1 hypothetical protein [Synergistaceae bacterium]